MKILVIGGGGREHALIWKLRESPAVQQIYCAPGNAGIAALADCVPIEPTSLVEAADFAEKLRIDLTVVGPELPLTLGIVDEFGKRGLPIFGPSRAAAEIEGSKAFAKEFLGRHQIPTARHETVSSVEAASRLLDRRETRYPVVLKVDGLAAGKGVVIARTRAEADAFVREVLEARTYGNAGDRLLIEEHLEGVEASFFALSDGRRVVPLVGCQDYKRLGDGDTGPNTGGMGALSPTPRLDPETFQRVVREVILPTVSGLAAEGRPYRGVLYAGLMLCADGPKVLEFNARFGDPETQVLMPRLKGDLLPALLAAASGTLEETHLEWRRESCVTVVAAAQGYPGRYETGQPIAGISEAETLDGVAVFHAGTRLEGRQAVTVGGRVLAISALGADGSQAAERAYHALERIRFDGMVFRTDIGRDTAAARR